MTRRIPLTALATAQCVLASMIAAAPARATQIPQYFFGQWTVTANCTEAQAGPAARVQAGLQFKISQSPNGTDTLQTINASDKQWDSGWQSVKLTYRAGTKMSSLPADFECVAGSEGASANSSPFLAMSGYAQTVEPQYPQEHWYGLAKIDGQLEHVLIFPRAVKGDHSAIIVLQSATTGSNVVFDDNGVIDSRN